MDPSLFERLTIETMADARTDERSQAEARFIARCLGAAPGARLGDIGCGHGRHLLALARLGYRVTGIDLNSDALALARAAVAGDPAGANVDTVLADVRDAELEGCLDGAYNYMSAIGFHDDPRDDRTLLEAVLRALRPGARFLLDYPNALHLLRAFTPGDVTRTRSGYVVTTTRLYHALRGTLTRLRQITSPAGETAEQLREIRLYTAPELVALLTGVGFAIEAAFGADDGRALDLDSPRCVLVARRP